jgi:hypothetical protein
MLSEDERWRNILDQFSYCEQCWASDPDKERLTPENVEIIDLWFRVLRRFLDTKPHTMINRAKFLDKLDLLSFLLGFAQMEMGLPLSDL